MWTAKESRRRLASVLIGALLSLGAMPVAHALSTDATLSALGAWSNGTLSAMSPTFASSTYSYSASASAATTSVTVQPATNWPNLSTIQVKIGTGAYTTVASYGTFTANINAGANVFTIFVTAQDGVTTLTYTYTVTRAAAASTDATLSALSLSSGTLSPTFASSTYAYSDSTTATTITVTPTVNQANATVQIRIGGGSNATVTSGTASGPLSLNVGAFNYIYVTVTAQDGITVLTYTITVTRISTDATLQSLALSWPGALSPAFDSATANYSASVSSSTASLTVTPAATDQTNATIKVRVNGGVYATVASWAASAPLALNTGSNTIDVLVTAQDGTSTKLYSISVTRAAPASTDATLSGLSLSSGTLSPTFAGGTYSYTASTAAASITVTPTVNQANATVQVRIGSGSNATVASGSASSSLSLNVGAYNFVYVTVTAQDGTTVLTYTITVTRLSTDATLQSLALSWPGVLSPTFDTSTATFAANVSSATTSLTVTPAATDQANATIKVRINGGTYSAVASWAASASLPLNPGSNTIEILVTAADGSTTKLYSITVTRVSAPPTAVTATSANSGAAITWTASTGATSYTVTSSPGNFTCTTATTGCTVTGLTIGTTYTFTVTATNSAGTSVASTASNSLKITAAPVVVTPQAVTPPPVTPPAVTPPVVTPPVITPVVVPPPVVAPPVASTDSPVTEQISANAGGVVKASIQSDDGKTLPVSITVPPNTVPMNVNISILPAATASEVASGFVTIRVSATASGALSVTQFTNPLTIDLGKVSAQSTPAFSNDGITWTPIQLLPGTTLVNGLQQGYYFATDGSTVILTRHLTYFGAKSAQAPLEIAANAAGFTVGGTGFLTVSGGSGDGLPGFTTTTPAICSVSDSGVLSAQLPGQCTIIATKAGSGIYMNASPSSLNVTIYKNVPTAPTIGSATAVDSNAAIVTFTPPAFDGGSQITSYTALSSPVGLVGVAAADGTNAIRVTGLVPGQTYTFTVTATNSVGTSLASAPSNPVSVGSAAVPIATQPTMIGTVYFTRSTSALDHRAYVALKRILARLERRKFKTFYVTGFTDITKGLDNSALSQARAERVRAYLASHGILGRFIVKGNGSTHLVAPGRTHDPLNRRVEIQAN